MNWRNTGLLVGIAAALFAFIFLFERHVPTHETTQAPRPLLVNFKPAEVDGVQLRSGTAFVIGLDRTNDLWRYSSLQLQPFSYPAESGTVQAFLDTLANVIPAAYITPAELVARKQTSAHFGFDAPAIAITLRTGSERHELRFGARTTAGDQVYAEVGGMPGIFVVNATIMDRLPRTQNDWRDTALFTLPRPKVDRFDVARGAAGFSLQRDPTNKLWRLIRPAHRADQLEVEYFLERLQDTRILQFVTDDPRADLESFGLATPAAELSLGTGTQSEKVQFGRSPTNDNTRVYARQANGSNIVVVPRAVIDLLAKPYTELRDRRLIGFDPQIVDTIEVSSETPFITKRQPDGTWTTADMPVDSQFVNNWLAEYAQMQVRDVVKDVVTDFTPFGLAPPRRQVTFRSTVTNALGAVTNVVVAQLDFGTNQTAETIYVRRADEDSVYTIHYSDYLHTPAAAWQLRDHRVWNFSTNEVLRVVVKQGNSTRQFLRNNGNWASTGGEVNPFAIEETVFRLGELSAVAWVAKGEAARTQYGFGASNLQVSVDVKDGAKLKTLSIEFGGANPLQLPYASTIIDGEPWIFEFPWPLYADVQRYLLNATPAP